MSSLYSSMMSKSSISWLEYMISMDNREMLFEQILIEFLHQLLLDKLCTMPCLHPCSKSICSSILGCSLHKKVSILLSFLIHNYWDEFIRAFRPRIDDNLNLLTRKRYAHHHSIFVQFEEN